MYVCMYIESAMWCSHHDTEPITSLSCVSLQRPVDLRSALSLSVSSGRGLSASPYEVARQSSDACEMMAGRYATLEHAEEEGEVEEREEEDIDTDEHFWQPPDTEEELYATLERKRYSFVPQESVR